MAVKENTTSCVFRILLVQSKEYIRKHMNFVKSHEEFIGFYLPASSVKSMFTFKDHPSSADYLIIVQ